MFLMPVIMASPFLALLLFYVLPFKTALLCYIMILLVAGYCYYVMFKSMRDKAVTGWEKIIGKEALVIEDIDPEGKIEFKDEIWTATAGGRKIVKGKKVKIVKASGLLLIVDSVDENEKPSDKLKTKEIKHE